MVHWNWIIQVQLIKGLFTKLWVGFRETNNGECSTPGLATVRSHYQALGLEGRVWSSQPRERQLYGKGCLTRIVTFSIGMWATYGDPAKRIRGRHAPTPHSFYPVIFSESNQKPLRQLIQINFLDTEQGEEVRRVEWEEQMGDAQQNYNNKHKSMMTVQLHSK